MPDVNLTTTGGALGAAAALARGVLGREVYT
jgi:hypothetical protein